MTKNRRKGWIDAALPPLGLAGLDSRFSRLVDARASDGVVSRWHILDNGVQLDHAGVTPIGTILCVHGNPTWSYLWRDLLTAATDAAMHGRPAWRVIAVDQLEMGYSERTGVVRPLAQRVRDLDALTSALALDGPVVTFGHDWGGVVSLGWAIDHPEVLSGVLLLNTAVHQPEEYPIPAPLRLILRPSLLAASTVRTPAFLETTLALAHPSLDGDVKAGYRAPYRRAARRRGIGAFVADIPVDATHPSAAELDRIASGVAKLEVPALLLWGARDPIFSDRYLDDLVDRLPHADVHRFEEAGHLIAEDVDFASAALDWLSDQAAGVADPVLDDITPERIAPELGEYNDTPPHDPAPPRPMWHYLDDLRDSTDTALVEMAPAGAQGPRVVSWTLLARRVHEIAAGLVDIGVRQGDRISLLVQPGADLTAILYACLRIGAVVVVADAGLGLRGLSRAVRGSWPDHVIGSLPGLAAARALGWPGQKISTTRIAPVTARALGIAMSLPEVVERGRGRDLPPEPDGAAPAAVLFTSGSTGPAKGVVYTGDQLAAVRDALATQFGIGVGTGLVAGFAPFALLGPALGARSVTPDMDVTSPKTLTARAAAAAAAAVDATVLFLSPAAIVNVAATSAELTSDDVRALSRVQTFLSAGAPISEALAAEASRLMPNAEAHTPYGMTEGLLMTDISLAGIRDAAAGADLRGGSCVGVPASQTTVLISALDSEGRATGVPSASADITGEIVVSAPHLRDHYDRLWLTNRESVRDTGAGARWHRTGDVGRLDRAGRLWVEGRLPHLILTADGVVTPVGPEQRAERVPAVARAAVVGVGPRGTQQLVVIVETTPPARRVRLAAPELAAAVRSAVDLPLAAVLVVPQLPTDIRHNSKIDRPRLARWAEGILSGGRRTRP